MLNKKESILDVNPVLHKSIYWTTKAAAETSCCQCIDIVGLSLGINHVRSKICISPISAIFLATRPLEDYPQFNTQNAQLSTMAGFKFSYERKCPLKENCFWYRCSLTSIFLIRVTKMLKSRIEKRI